MKHLVILGGGTAGTMVANRMVRALDSSGWRVTVIDPAPVHLYQPGLIFLPFGARDEDEMVRSRRATLDRRVRWLQKEVHTLDHEHKQIELSDGSTNSYDLLVIASGSRIRPEMTEGLGGEAWHRHHFDFYTLNGATALRDALASFDAGRLVINVVEMPIKCPVAPLEFAFLADAFFTERGVREAVEIVYAVPLDGAFTKPQAAKRLGHLLADKHIELVTDFSTGSVDPDRKTLVSYDERQVPFDLLVSIPTHTGAPFVERSGIGDELAFIPTDKHTLAAKQMADVFVLGDATDLPTSKAGSVAHFESEALAGNLLRAAGGKAPDVSFDGHANCFIETGHGRAMLIDFNYELEPVPGDFPLPVVGPFSLMQESRTNHWGKLFFRWLYWHGLLPAKPLPVPHRMSMLGKRVDATPTAA